MSDITDEQRLSVDLLAAGTSVVLEAHYGSGKTTTILAAVAAIEAVDGTALALAYNANMKNELRTRRRASEARGNSRRYTHSLHSAAMYFYGVKGATDAGIHAAIDGEPAEGRLRDLAAVTHVLVDEAQDLTPLFFRFLVKLLGDIGAAASRVGMFKPWSVPVVMLVGDPRQAVNLWNGADARFLTMAPTLLDAPGRTWARCELTRTFRCPPPVVALNNAVNGINVRTEREPAADGRDRPELIRCDVWDTTVDNAAYARVMAWLTEFAREDVLILVPSLKRSTPAHVLQTLLGDAGVASYQPARGGSGNADAESSLRGKVRFSTYHASKGMEAPCVLALCFDSSCEWLSEGHPTGLPPAFHVAMTRCKERLTLVESRAAAPVPALEALRESLSRYVDVPEGRYDLGRLRKSKTASLRSASVTDFASRGVSEPSLEDALGRVEWTRVPELVMEDADGDEVVLEPAPGVVPSNAADGAVEDVTVINDTVATTLMRSMLGVDFGDVPALRTFTDRAPVGIEERRRLRMEYVETVGARGDPCPWTVTLAALAHEQVNDGFTTLVTQVADRRWWTPDHVLAVRAAFEHAATGTLRSGQVEVSDLWKRVDRSSADVSTMLLDTTVCGKVTTVQLPDGRVALLDMAYDGPPMADARALATVVLAYAAFVADLIKAGSPCVAVSLRTGEARAFDYDPDAVSAAVSASEERDREAHARRRVLGGVGAISV
jgi:TusA-related sulfurtransferase